MKFKKIFLIGLLFLGLGALSTTNHVQAATAKRVNVPQKFRGTWYAADQNKVKAYKITKSKITVMFFTPVKNSKTYKYTKYAYSTLPQNNSKYTLIKFKGNQMYFTIPGGESSRMLLSKDHKKMYVAVNMMITTYYKSKNSAKKYGKRDNSRAYYANTLIKYFDKNYKLKV